MGCAICPNDAEDPPTMDPIPALTERYLVPKTAVPIELRLAWQEPAELSLYLARQAQKHTGTECPSDLLNGGDRFIPATDSDGRLLVVHRDAVMVLSVAAEYELEWVDGQSEEDGVATTVELELTLEDDTRVTGAISYWRPEGQRRLQDYFNSADQFIPVREGDTVHLVNRDRIVSVSPA